LAAVSQLEAPKIRNGQLGDFLHPDQGTALRGARGQVPRDVGGGATGCRVTGVTAGQGTREGAGPKRGIRLGRRRLVMPLNLGSPGWRRPVGGGNAWPGSIAHLATLLEAEASESPGPPRWQDPGARGSCRGHFLPASLTASGPDGEQGTALCEIDQKRENRLQRFCGSGPWAHGGLRRVARAGGRGRRPERVLLTSTRQISSEFAASQGYDDRLLTLWIDWTDR